MLCVVCEAPVEIETAEQEMYIDPAGIAAGIQKKSVLAVCEKRRCQRLVKEVLAEEGRRRVGQG